MKRFCGNRKGIGYLMTFIFMLTMAVMVTAFLDISTNETRELKGRIEIGKTFWFADAGIQKAVWMIITPVTQGGGGFTYTTGGSPPETLDEGSYTYSVTIPNGRPNHRVIISVGSYLTHTYTVQQEFDIV